jgi:hypothetical protein
MCQVADERVLETLDDHMSEIAHLFTSSIEKKIQGKFVWYGLHHILLMTLKLSASGTCKTRLSNMMSLMMTLLKEPYNPLYEFAAAVLRQPPTDQQLQVAADYGMPQHVLAAAKYSTYECENKAFQTRINTLLTKDVQRLAAEIILSLIFSEANAAQVTLNEEWISQLRALLSDPQHAFMRRELQGVFMKLSLKKHAIDKKAGDKKAGGYSNAGASGGASANGASGGGGLRRSSFTGTQLIPSSFPSVNGPVVMGRQKLMISYCWTQQAIVKQVYQCLRDKGYDVWLDIHKMAEASREGGVLDAMSAAIDEADVVLVAVSREYKNSANCRLEAEYAHTQGKRIVYMMMQEDFIKPSGWLGMLLGSKLWHAMFDDSEPAAAKVEPLIQAL